MVKESRIVFEIGDIKGIRVQCHKCKGEVVQSFKSNFYMPSQCLLCNEPWAPPGRDFATAELLRSFHAVLRQELPMTVRLELSDSTSPTP